MQGYDAAGGKRVYGLARRQFEEGYEGNAHRSRGRKDHDREEPGHRPSSMAIEPDEFPRHGRAASGARRWL